MPTCENGRLRVFVQTNVQDRDLGGFVREVMERIQKEVELPNGMTVEFSGEYENQIKAERKLPQMSGRGVVLLHGLFRSGAVMSKLATYLQNQGNYMVFNVTYPTTPATGCTGDVYVSGSYSSSLMVAAANNIIVNGNLTTSEDSSGNPTGGATLGLVANQFVRVMHGCSSNTNVPSQSFSNLQLDAAILALQHSFIVDNYNCGACANSVDSPVNALSASFSLQM